jgi:hypothetical protein
MPSRSHAKLEVFLFLIGAFVPICLLALYAAKSGGLAKAGWITPLAMLAPMLSAMLVQRFLARQKIKDLGFSRGRLVWWLLAPFLFALFVVASVALSIWLTPALLASPAEINAHLNSSSLLPHAAPLGQKFAIAVAITLFVGPVLNLPIFLGEEVGWRGFLNDRLRVLWGRPGLIVGGIIWAVWHLPVILLGHNYPQHPWLGMLIWMPICVCLNILLAAVRKKGRSIMPCALSHGIINQLTMLLLSMTAVESHMLDLVHGPAGLIGLMLLIPPAAIVYRRAFREPQAD